MTLSYNARSQSIVRRRVLAHQKSTLARICHEVPELLDTRVAPSSNTIHRLIDNLLELRRECINAGAASLAELELPTLYTELRKTNNPVFTRIVASLLMPQRLDISKLDFAAAAFLSDELKTPIDNLSTLQAHQRLSLLALEIELCGIRFNLDAEELGVCTSLTRNLVELVQDIQLEWYSSFHEQIAEVLNAARLLAVSLSSKQFDMHGEFAELRVSTNLVLALLQDAPARFSHLSSLPETPTRALHFGAEAASEEYLSILLPDAIDSLVHTVRSSASVSKNSKDKLGFCEKCNAIVISVSVRVCRSRDGFSDLVVKCFEGFRELWSEQAKVGRTPTRDLQSQPVVNLSHILSGFISFCNNAKELHYLKVRLEEFLESDLTRATRAPASVIAPLRMLVGQLSFRLFRLQGRGDEIVDAVRMTVESLRLNLQQPKVSTGVLSIGVQRLHLLSEFARLSNLDKGILEFAKACVAEANAELHQAKEGFAAAGEFLALSLKNTEQLGVINLTNLLGKAFHHAATIEAARGNQIGSRDLLLRGADLIDAVAKELKIEKSRLELNKIAAGYRTLANT